MIRGPRPLKDHIATVCAYLNDYKNQTDPNAQSVDSGKFTSYLISTCWEKMIRRISSWQAKGFIFLINRVVLSQDLHTFGQEWDFPSTVEQGDRTLIGFLKCLDDRMKEKLILDYYCHGDTDPQATVRATPSDFSLIFNIVSSSSLAPVFSRETIQEFHKLTVAAFNGYVSSFLRLKKKSKNMVGICY